MIGFLDFRSLCGPSVPAPFMLNLLRAAVGQNRESKAVAINVCLILQADMGGTIGHDIQEFCGRISLSHSLLNYWKTWVSSVLSWAPRKHNED